MNEDKKEAIELKTFEQLVEIFGKDFEFKPIPEILRRYYNNHCVDKSNNNYVTRVKPVKVKNEM